MHEPYKSNDISRKKHLWCKKVWLSKVHRIIPGSEYINILATKRSDIRIPPRGLAN